METADTFHADKSNQRCRYFFITHLKRRAEIINVFKVTYGITVSEDGVLVTEQELSLRNITVNIGCSCSYFVPIMFQDVNLVEEKRKRRRK